MRFRRSAAIYCLTLVFCLSPAASNFVLAQDWPQWRGPNRDGIVTGFRSPVSWPDQLKLQWKTPVGGGFSSPVVHGERAYVHSRDDAKGLEVVTSIELKTGKIVWTESYSVRFDKNQYAVAMGKGPNSTPVIFDGKLYTLGMTAIVSCFDARSGALKWRKDFSQHIDTSKLFCGTAMSPVVDNGRLIVHVGDDRGGWIKALDGASGEEKWNLKIDGPGYASPIVADIEGVRQVVTLTDRSIIGVDVDRGTLLWRVDYKDEWNENIVTPIICDGKIVVSGVRRGTMALKVTRAGEVWTVSEAWKNRDVAMYMNSPVVDGHLIYGLSHLRKGQFFCVDGRTGKTLWITEGREGDNSSLLRAGEVLIALTTDGAVQVIKKSDKAFERIRKYQIADGAIWSHPVLFGNQILIKDSGSLALWAF